MPHLSAADSWDRLLQAAWPADTLVQFLSRYPCNPSLDAWLSARAETEDGFKLLRLTRVAHGTAELEDGSQWVLLGLPLLCDAASGLGGTDVHHIAHEWTKSLAAVSGVEIQAMRYPVTVAAVQAMGATHWSQWVAAFAQGEGAFLEQSLPLPTTAGPWVWVAGARSQAGAAPDVAAAVLQATTAATPAWRMRCEQLLQQALGVPIQLGAPLFLADALAAATLGTLSRAITRAQAGGTAVSVQRNGFPGVVELREQGTGVELQSMPGRELPDSALAPLVHRASR